MSHIAYNSDNNTGNNQSNFGLYALSVYNSVGLLEEPIKF